MHGSLEQIHAISNSILDTHGSHICTIGDKHDLNSTFHNIDVVNITLVSSG